MIRPATHADCDPWLVIRNDPEAMFWSGQAQPIPVAGHRAWFERALVSDEGLYVATDWKDEAVLGYGRVQPVGLISVAMAPTARGQGLGTQVLTHLTAEAQRVGMGKLMAVIHPSNVASMRAFMRAGYGVHPVGECVVQKVLG